MFMIMMILMILTMMILMNDDDDDDENNNGDVDDNDSGNNNNCGSHFNDACYINTYVAFNRFDLMKCSASIFFNQCSD